MEYYEGLPFRPGLEAFLWLAKCANGNRVLDVQMPDAIVLQEDTVTWLRSVKSTSLVIQPYTHRVQSVPTAVQRFKRQLKRDVCVDLALPLSRLSRAQLLAPVAVVRTVGPMQSTNCSVVVQGLYDVLVKEPVPSSPPSVIQRFVKCRGPKPAVYRVVWRKCKSAYALVITSKRGFHNVSSVLFVFNLAESAGQTVCCCSSVQTH